MTADQVVGCAAPDVQRTAVVALEHLLCLEFLVEETDIAIVDIGDHPAFAEVGGL